jgi:class 3 adenylate cyclase
MAAADEFDEIPVEGNDFRERVSPHELNGLKRQQWMSQLWKAFNDLARGGSITLTDAITIAETLHVDGEERFIDEHVPDPKEVTFKQLVQVLDDMSRASGNEYRDIEMERAVAEDGAHVEYLGPFDYLRYLCSGRESFAAERNEGAGSSVNVEYRLAFRTSELTPKQVLIVTTVSLLLVIVAVTIVGMLLMWDYTIVEAVERNMNAIHQGVSILVDTIEAEMVRFHALGIISSTELLARWSESESDLWRGRYAVRNQILSQRVAHFANGVVTENALRNSAATIARDSLVRDLVQLTLSVDSTAAIAFIGGVATALVPSRGLCNTTAAFTFRNGSAVCIDDPDGHLTTSSVESVATSLVDKVNEALGQPETFAVSLINNNSVKNLQNGRCLTAYTTDPSMDYCTRFASTVTAAAGNGTLVGEWASMRNATYTTGATGVSTLSVTGGIVAVQTSLASILDKYRWRMVSVVNTLNFEYVRSTEIVISMRNQASGVITAQTNTFRFSDGCYFDCVRTPPSSMNVKAAFERKNSGWSLTPDYRPEPVIGGYAYVAHDLDMAIVFERDVIEVRGISFGVIREMLRSVNRALDGDLAVEAIGYAGAPLMQNFPAYTACPSTTDCFVDPKGPLDRDGYGLYFRYDCRHCQRIAASELRGSSTVNYVCEQVTEDDEPCAIDSETGWLVLDGRSTSPISRTEQRSGTAYLVASRYALNYSVALSLVVTEDRSTGRFRVVIKGTAGGLVGILLVGLLVLFLSSMSSFTAIEAEWSSYKTQLEAEKAKFGTLVQGLIPPTVAERLMSGHRVLADHVSTASFVFVDICGFSELTRTWTARHVARFMTYCVSLLESVASYCEVLKLRSIGDLMVVVGLRDDKHRSEVEYHPVRRALQYSSITMLLFSKLYVHRPQTSRLFRELFKDKARDGSDIEMPAVRIGVHCGQTVCGAFSIGRVSHYDFFGPGPALANRMQQTALPNRIHATVMVKEMLRNRDPNNKYIFDHSRKTVVRGHGTITSYFVRTVTERVPHELMLANGIDHGRIRFEFQKGMKYRQHEVDETESVVSSISDD